MRDEKESLAVIHPPRRPVRTSGSSRRSGCARFILVPAAFDARMSMPHAPLFQIVLQEITTVVHCLRRLDLEAHPVRQLIDLAEDLLELFTQSRSPNGPRPTGTRKKTFHITIASFSNSAHRLSRSCALCRLIVVCTWIGIRPHWPIRSPGSSVPKLPAIRETYRESPAKTRPAKSQAAPALLPST